jgi:membrane-associated protease RseP (regulator of RpoE activity)
MKRNILVLLGSLLVIALLGIGSLGAAQDSTKSAATVVAAGDEPDVLYFNAGEDEEEPPVVAPPPHPMALPHPGRQTFLFRAREGDGTWLGVRLEEVTAEKAKELKLAGEYGVTVKDVEEGSPAAKAGVAKDDVIVEFAGEKVRSVAQLGRLVRETPPGRTVTLLVSRAGQPRTLSVKLEARAEGTFEMPGMPPMPRLPNIEIPEFDFVWQARGVRLGISGDELTPQLAEYFGVKQGKGVLVREVVVGSAAAKAGLKAGDVIVAVDGKEVASVGKLRRALAGDTEEKRKVTLTIVRDKREQTLAVELEPAERVSPRRVTHTELIGIDPEEMAAEAQVHAEEIEARAREWQKEQERLQEEMRRLQQELPEQIEKEIGASRGVV